MSELISLNVSVVNILKKSQKQIVSVPARTFVTLHREGGTLLLCFTIWQGLHTVLIIVPRE